MATPHDIRCEGEPAGTAPGVPGIDPTWASSGKDLVGTAMGPARLWFTLGHGILNEVYWPRIDLPQIRDLGFIVADDAGFRVELKRLANFSIAVPAAGVPLQWVDTGAWLQRDYRIAIT